MTDKEKMLSLLEGVGHAFTAFSQGFDYQKTAGELFIPFRETLYRELGDIEILYDYIWGEDALKMEGVTREDYRPQVGDSVILDISVGKNGVWCDVCRTFFVGLMTGTQQMVYDIIKKSIRSAEEFFTAGTPASEIHFVMQNIYHTYSQHLVHHAGHQVGIGPLEEPFFVEGNNTPLEAGKFYTLESGCYNGCGIRLENDYLLHETSLENLSEQFFSLEKERYILR